MDPYLKDTNKIVCESICIRGIVQGVGFRPTVWRIANDYGLTGSVTNNANGVLIKVKGQLKYLNEFVKRLEYAAPSLARIDSIERQSINELTTHNQFHIQPSELGDPRTDIVPDTIICQSCIEDIFDPLNKKYAYPFTNCTHCGPRFSIVKAIPYDRYNTSMTAFTMCQTCDTEYHDPSNRRFHAQPNACPKCGPSTWLESNDNNFLTTDPGVTSQTDIDSVCSLLSQGLIVAIKGIGGFHLACNALDEDAVKRLRQRKKRYHKPFALMAYDVAMIARYCEVTELEKKVLLSAAAPITLLKMNKNQQVASAVAPDQSLLGFMLPYTPLYQLILKNIDYPIVFTSGNTADEPPCIDNTIAKNKLSFIADYFLFNDRDIVNRIDDSVVRIIANTPQIMRRARGYAPSSLALPKGFVNSPEVLAMGGELKNTFCFIKNDKAIISQHLGDLENAVTFVDYQKNIKLYSNLYHTNPDIIAIDYHPDYLSSKEGRRLSEDTATKLTSIQHHHAHIASCMAENNIPLKTQPILGIALDGLGLGDDQTLWGGEFLLVDYVSFERVATFKPVPMLGGARAIYEPWRNTYAHIQSALGWENYQKQFKDLKLTDYLNNKPLASLNALVAKNMNCPLSSSCGRLFDAVAAALGICQDQVAFEGQAAMTLEAIADGHALLKNNKEAAYPFSISTLNKTNMLVIDPKPLWQAILKDIGTNVSTAVISARFHKGLANTIGSIINKLLANNPRLQDCNTVALSGGVFQNKILSELVILSLQEQNLTVLHHQNIPPNDGGLSFGQAIIASARLITKK